MDYCDICIADAAKQSAATGIDTATCTEQCDMWTIAWGYFDTKKS